MIADADTGYGNELNVTRTVREYERAGVAGIHIEDQVMPKRCGHLDGKEIVPRDEFVAKIRAAVAARQRPGLRGHRPHRRARRGRAWTRRSRRVNAALEAGADMAFVEAPQTLDEVAAVPAPGARPLPAEHRPRRQDARHRPRDAEAMGYRLAIMPACC